MGLGARVERFNMLGIKKASNSEDSVRSLDLDTKLLRDLLVLRLIKNEKLEIGGK